MAFRSFEISIPRRPIRTSWRLTRNLFVNHKLSINNIAQTLDETYKNSVSTLIEQGIIQDRGSVCREERQFKQSSLFGFRLKNSGGTDSQTEQRQTPGSSERKGSSQYRER